MSSQLTVTQTRELIEGLKGAVQDFAAAEEKLNREFRQKVDATEKRFKEDSEALAAQLAGQLAEANTAFETAKARFQTRDEQRTARITRARKSSQKLSVERIEQEEGGWKHRSQKGLLDTKRWRTDSFALNDTRLAEFNSQLGENRGAFAALEQAADKSFRGYGKFRRQLAGGKVLPNTDLSPDEHQLLEKLRELHGHTAEDLAKFNGLLLPKIFRVLPLWLWFAFLAVVAGALPMILQQLGKGPITHVQTGIAAAIVFGLVLGTYLSGQSKASSLANTISNELETARRLHQIASEKAQTRHATEVERIEREAKERADMYNEHWRTAVQQAAQAREVWPGAIEAKWRRVAEKNVRLNETRFTRLETEHTATATRLNQEANTRKQTLTETHRARIEKFNADYQAHWKKLEEDWQQSIQPIWNTIRQANMAAEESFPPWQPDLWKNWRPPGSFKNAARFARLELDLKKFADAAPQDKRLAFPGPSVVSLPLVLTYPNQGSILFETTKSGNESVVAALNNIIFRLLATSPAGKLSFTIIDPVKLGQNFAAVTHLADFEENILNGRIWTQSNQIEEQLARLNEHMEKVIQMYLRNEYETIAEYNVQAGNIAEKYHFVVIADFPANFSETAVKRLLRIAASGARCGVFTLIHWDHRHTTPPDFFPEELRKSSVCINATENHFVLAHPMLPRANVLLDAPPDADFATEFLQRVGEISRGSNRVEVPFEQVAPPAAETWSEETTEELRVPIGRSGATKLQYLSIGKGTRQHALIAGKTGSGKSTLFHIIITNLALWCSPEQVEFYLVDFKKGVEFKSYAANRLPHAKVVAIESDREFGLSVLQKLDEELKRRGELFRKLGVQDVAGYKRAGGTEPMPRALLMIDEFQEFFVEDDRISQAANLLLDRIVRQGRAFGIHCLLGSQTLGGAYTLARTTIGQMVIRIALQCNEADAYLIMDENNPAPRLLSRPGEGIYNDMAGMMEGNSPFQAVWLGDEERDVRLERVRALADEKLNGNYPGPIVFEGNAPADVRENLTLRSLLDAPAVQPSPLARVWLGAPNSIKGPTEAVFQKRSGNNLLMVGQRDEPVLAMLSVALISLAAQFPRGTARFILFESTATASPEREFLERTIKAIPHEITLARGGDFSEIMNGLADDLKRRTDSEHADAPTTFVFIHGLQNFKKFKQDEDFAFTTDDSSGANAAAQLQKLISEGPSHGIHVFATVDTYNNVNRYLGRKTLSEFEMRVLFQMSTNDSASLCDDPKASTLGLHRALFYNEQEGYLETFRPYALPGSEWIEQTAKKLSR